MSITLEQLAETLEKSVNKNGSIPLSNSHMLNLIRMTIKKQTPQPQPQAVTAEEPPF